MGSTPYTHLDPITHSEPSPLLPAASKFHLGITEPYNVRHVVHLTSREEFEDMFRRPKEDSLEMLPPIASADIRPLNSPEDRSPRKRRRRRRRVRKVGSRPNMMTGEVISGPEAFTHFNQMRQQEERAKEKGKKRKRPRKKIKEIGLPTDVQHVTHITASDPRLQQLLNLSPDDPRVLQILGGT
ncbi:MAG: uncharacterized protein KVP18_004143 [Porospora cf. gigantea A]|uniref:uncharacterized protein n=1 Tax=Porospora cf. gigantea A TaxID=2853593 RepID=UPI0035599659|nr:MAG: hypothetical protein KVP18_004143 [Porospora cf. gigantea A]